MKMEEEKKELVKKMEEEKKELVKKMEEEKELEKKELVEKVTKMENRIRHFDQASELSLKDQKKCVTWENILAGMEGIEASLKPEVINKLSRSYDPLAFLSREEDVQEIICEFSGITGWASKLCDHILKVSVCMPA